jgi:TolB protein
MKRQVIIQCAIALAVFWGTLNINLAFAQTPMISFLSDRSGADEVYLLFDDGTVKQLTNNKARTIDPGWSPDGKMIIYGSNPQGGELFDIFTIDVETQKIQNLTQGNFGNNMQKPRWAPAGDARAIVESPNLPNGNNWDIGLIDLTGRRLNADDIFNVTNIDGAAVGQDIEGSWSPDGTLIAFQSERDGSFDIFIAEMDPKKPGGKQRNLTNDPGDDRRPRWSLNGKKILFESKRDGDWEIFMIDIDGKNLQQLTNNDATDRNAEWSIKGIVFESSRDGNFEIYRMDENGGDQINLTNDAGLDSDPIWAPTGSRILFESRRDGNREIYVMDADGSNLQNLTSNPAKDVFARWNPLYFFLSVEPEKKQLTAFGEVKRASLLQNYPNPFNPETWIPYHLAEESYVAVRIYDVTGELVRLIEIGRQPAGAYVNRSKAAYWDGRDNLGAAASSGLYFYELAADDFSQARKMILMK